jgi:putative acetyltransferase
MNIMSGFALQPLEILEADPTSAECRMLLAAHDYFASTRRSAAHCDAVGAAALKAAGTRLFIARHKGQPVACGAISGEGDTQEISRVYTVEAARHRRVAYRLLAEMEDAARKSGAKLIRLEAGRWQTEALEFFERAGYEPGPPYGRFRGADDKTLSACMFYEKAL